MIADIFLKNFFKKETELLNNWFKLKSFHIEKETFEKTPTE